MKILQSLPLVTLTIATNTLLFLNHPNRQTALAQPFCGTDGDYEEAAETTRTLRLEDFDISVEIPSNYRAMKQQDGSVAILHPDDFQMLQCIAQGGAGGHGYYSETIELVEDDLTMNLREQALWTAGYGIDAQGNRYPVYDEVMTYEKNGISGYIVTSQSGYSATFLGTIPNSSKLLKVSAGCDCEVEAESVLELLDSMTLLN